MLNPPAGKVLRYGFPPFGVDPVDYEPDPDVCSDAEIGAWQEACARSRAGITPDPHRSDNPFLDGSAWGVGTWIDDHDPMLDGER